MSRLTAIVATVALLVGLGVSHVSAAGVAAIETDHTRTDIMVRQSAVAPGEATDVALAVTLDDGWHTYWINPGDSGAAPSADWTLPAGGKAAPLAFPAPEPVPYPPLMNHGYKGALTLLTSLEVPADWPVGEPYPVTLDLEMLVCSDICVPEGGSASFFIPTAAASEPDSTVAFSFMQAEWALPEASDADATYSRDGETIYLTVPFGTPEGAHFFAYDSAALDHVAEQLAVSVSDGEGMTLRLTAGRGDLDGTLAGVLTTVDGAYAISATGDPDAGAVTAGASLAAASGDGEASAGGADTTVDGGGAASAGNALTDDGRTALAAADPANTAEASVAAGSGVAPWDVAASDGLPLWRALVFAFLGGVILNLMPCVFPVLALKALGLVAHADAPLARRAAIGGAYTLGILVSFSALAGLLLALKAAGASVGWGFQLQSPAFVAAMALALFAIGLNLSGVFEVGGGLTRLGGFGPREGVVGSFATGALATVVATPCTAPFMAVAIGAALAASPVVALGVFAALGLGLAAPFVLLTLVPGAARSLPRPGIWMERLRQALAFPLYATAAWLIWVLAQIAGVDTLLSALFAFVLVACAAWLYGLAQRGSGRSHRVAGALALASLAAALFALWPAALGPETRPAVATARAATTEPYSAERLATLRDAGAPVFVNVTAAWCITCKVNERMVLTGEGFEERLATHGVAYLEADWTRRDAEVTRFIESFGRAGVPLYVMFPPDGAPRVLPQVLTASMLDDAFSTR